MADAEEPEILDVTPETGLRANTPLYSRALHFDEIEQLIGNWNDAMTRNPTIRMMVLETWLLVDYWIRLLLAVGLDIDLYGTDDLDIRYECLPESFERKLALVRDLYEAHKSLPDPVRVDFVTRFNTEFFLWLRKHHPDIISTITSAEDEFRAANGLRTIRGSVEQQLFSVNPTPFSSFIPETRKLPQRWIDLVSNLDDGWFKKCKRLNDARNVAAHSTDVLRIAKRFGIKGENAIELVRAECRALADALIGLVPNITSSGTASPSDRVSASKDRK